MLENHYLPLRGQAGPSILTFCAHEPHSRVLCYANANRTRTDQAGFATGSPKMVSWRS
jgi:hypothetical protein